MADWFWFTVTLSVVAVVLAVCALVAHVVAVALTEVGKAQARGLDGATEVARATAAGAADVARETGAATRDVVTASNPVPDPAATQKSMFQELLERAGVVDVEPEDDSDWTDGLLPDFDGPRTALRRADGTLVDGGDVGRMELDVPGEEWLGG